LRQGSTWGCSTSATPTSPRRNTRMPGAPPTATAPAAPTRTSGRREPRASDVRGPATPCGCGPRWSLRP
jgi:hypothetical protein